MKRPNAEQSRPLGLDMGLLLYSLLNQVVDPPTCPMGIGCWALERMTMGGYTSSGGFSRSFRSALKLVLDLRFPALHTREG